MDATRGNEPDGRSQPDTPWWVRLFSRETSGGAFVPVVDGLRFVAIAWVVAYHTAGYVAEKVFHVSGAVIPSLSGDGIYRFASVGFFGVQLFFVISGYILAMPFARQHMQDAKKVSLGGYLLRRVTRLEPPYVFNLVVLFALLIVVKGMNPGELAGHLLASIFYVHQFVYGEPSIINAAAWSLEIEVQFYILAPVLTTVFVVRPTWLRRGILVGSIVAFAGLQEMSSSTMWEGFALWKQLHYFLIGLLLAELSLTQWRDAARTSAWDVAGVAGWCGLVISLFYFVQPGSTIHGGFVHVFCSASILLAYAGAFRGKALGWLFSRPPLYLIGGACYTLYLWHVSTISLTGRVVQRFVPSSGMWAGTFSFTWPS